MNNKNKYQQLTRAGLFLALGLITPYITGHAAGIPGTIILPMHLPVLLAGFFTGPMYGLAVGILTPLLSSLLTGMPPVYPMLPIMLCELAVYGFLTGYLYKKRKLPIIPSLLVSMVAGRIAYALVFQMLLMSNPELKAASVVTAFTTGLPGIIIQLVSVPLIVKSLEKMINPVNFNLAHLESAKSIIKGGEHSCVVFSNEKTLHLADGHGVSPLLNMYENTPQLLKGNYVADKIIGKAAAMILIEGDCKFVYGELMSKSAAEYLKEKQIPFAFGRCVDMISNRDQTGICPMERAVLDIDDGLQGIEQIKTTVAILKQRAMEQSS